jgi:phenylalanyl-tRNA synthetase beta chain
MKISYNWLQNYFDEKLPEPEKISEGIIFHSFEVEDIEKKGDDTIFDIKILPDHAHDCLSHWGIAKEISAIFDLKIKNKENKIFDKKETKLEINIQDDKCLRYMGRVIRNIKVQESPEWLKDKLLAIGQRPINNIVDAANFVMFDLGQPIHCFDLDKLESEKIIIRNGKVSEKLTTLDKKEINLDESILIIADEKDPLAIAGIKGGTKAEVDSNTKNIVIEVANFNPTTTRKTAKKINIQTDAVKRYENEISPDLCSITMDSITDMISSLSEGEVEDIVDVYPKKQEQKIISVSVDYINKRLGSNFSKEEIESVWNKLKFEYSEKDNIFDIKIPLLRLDLNAPHDLTEEVIRILGFDRLEEKLPDIKSGIKTNELYNKMAKARLKLLEDGYSEVMTYAFCDSGEVEVLASASDKKFLRNNLTDGLKESIKLNLLNIPLLEMKDIKVFEIGTVFFKDKEEMHVAYGNKKGITEMTLSDFISENSSEFIAVQPPKPDRGWTAISKVFKPWSLYPFISRDIAVWVKEDTEPNKLFDIYKELGTELLIKDPELVDKFQKQDKISYAYRLVFQSYDRTLKDKEVNKIMNSITDKITSLGFEVR